MGLFCFCVPLGAIARVNSPQLDSAINGGSRLARRGFRRRLSTLCLRSFWGQGRIQVLSLKIFDRYHAATAGPDQTITVHRLANFSHDELCTGLSADVALAVDFKFQLFDLGGREVDLDDGLPALYGAKGLELAHSSGYRAIVSGWHDQQ